MSKYELTEAQRAEMAGWADKWIANALSCAPMGEQDRAEATAAVEALYRGPAVCYLRTSADSPLVAFEAMRLFRNQAAQGDFLVRRIETLPAGLVEQVADTAGGHIVAHSETGHHHRLIGLALAESQEQSTVTYLRMEEDNGLRAYMIIGPGGGAVLRHERDTHTHGAFLFAPGTYEARRQREHTPDGWKRVED